MKYHSRYIECHEVKTGDMFTYDIQEMNCLKCLEIRSIQKSHKLLYKERLKLLTYKEDFDKIINEEN